MAAYTGILVTGPTGSEDGWTPTVSATIAAASSDLPCPMPPPSLDSIIGIAKSSLNNTYAEASVYGYIGEKVESMLDDYYYRIHVTPSTMPFGAILSEQVDTFIVWNAYFVVVECSTIDITGGDEFELAGTDAPYNLVALEIQTYIVTVPKEGSATILSTIEFEFDTAEIRLVTITGIRMIVFAFHPQQPISEQLEWFTDIIKPRKGIGSEQRMSVRQTPRQSFSFSVLIESQKDQAILNAALFGWQKRSFGLPVWSEMVKHNADINADDLTITLDTTNADFRDESYALIIKSLYEYEAVKIDTVAADSLTLESAVVGTYTGSKLIIPLRIAQVNGPSKRNDHSTGLAIVDLSFSVKDNVLLTGYTPSVAYKGLPVITEATAVDPTQSKSIDSDSFVQDYKSGDFDYFSDVEFDTNLQSHLFYNDDKAACWDFRKFLHSLFGMQGTFWVPTFKKDMVQAEIIHAADTSFQIENISLAENMGLNDLRTYLAFIFPDGTQIYKEITGIVESDDAIEIISIDTALGVEVAIGGCVIGFMHLCRLASDSVDFKWPMAHQNECKTSLAQVVE